MAKVFFSSKIYLRGFDLIGNAFNQQKEYKQFCFIQKYLLSEGLITPYHSSGRLVIFLTVFFCINQMQNSSNALMFAFWIMFHGAEYNIPNGLT